jgi:hypothetical protein
MWQPSHRPVFVHHFTDNARRVQARYASDIDARFGLSWSNEHATVLCTKGKDVSGPSEILWPSLRVNCG